MDFDWKINGGHKQESREGYNLLDFNVTQDNRVTYNEDGSITINGVGAFSLKFNQITLEANKTYKQKMQLISGTIKDSWGKDMKDSAIMSFSSNVWLNTTKSSTYSKAEETSKSSAWVHQYAIFDNAKIKIWAYEGTEEKPYEQYGTMPSPDFPSEIKTVKDSVEVKVVNKNFVKIDETIDFSISNVQFTCKDGKLNLNGTSNTNISSVNNNFKNYFRFILPAGNYTFSQKNSVSSNIFTYILDLEDTSKRYATANGNSVKKASFTLEKTTEVFVGIYSGSNVTFNNVEIELQIEKGSTATDFVEYQEQAITMPIQQEMLEGDYVANVEHHEWRNLVLTGTEALVLADIYQGIAQFEIGIENSENNAEWGNDDKIRAFSNYYRGVIYNNSWIIDNCITTIGNGRPRIMTSQFTDVKSFKAWLKSKYDAGTPVIIYYKLAKHVSLELTEEQKAVRENKLYTYKNITNIDVSNELASIDVTYKKDLETMFNNIIKQIPSSTSDTAET